MKRVVSNVFIITLLLFFLCGCKIKGDTALFAAAPAFDYEKAAYTVSAAAKCNMTADFLRSLGQDAAEKLVSDIESGSYSERSA